MSETISTHHGRLSARPTSPRRTPTIPSAFAGHAEREERRRRYFLNLSAVSLRGLAHSLPKDQAAERAAAQSAERFLAQLDGGRFAASWDIAAPILHEALSSEAWTTALRGARGPLGRCARRRPSVVGLVEALPALGRRRYAVLRYDSQFEAGCASEVVTLTEDAAGRWRAAAYFIQ